MISASSASAYQRRAASNSPAIAAGATKLGVPPPKNTVASSRPRARGAHSSSSRSAARAQASSKSSIPEYELKSQYAHFTVQNGTWMYSPRSAPGPVPRAVL